MFAVSVTNTNDELTLGEPKVLFEGEFAPGLFGFVNYDVAADGEAFLMLQQLEGSEVSIVVVLNWFGRVETTLSRR